MSDADTGTGQLPAVDLVPPKAEPIKKNLTGASFLAGLIRTRQAKVKDQLAQAGNELNAVMDEMETLADAATNQVADAKAEVADLRAALGLNSNGDPS
jgi:outer membrane murein-binding lipoprotein Lpp